jgi:hypothetical protein
MKFKLLAVLLFTLSISLFSCSKSSNSPTPTNPIVGLWIGTQMPNDGSSSVPLYYSYDLKSDSTLLMQGAGSDGNTYYGVGKWSLTGTAFTAEITATNLGQAGVKQNITAVYSSGLGKLANGTIQTVGNSYSATFTLDRIN